MKNNRKGFTIVELVIVIAVIAILAAVLIPTFASLNKKAKVAADTQLAKHLNTALATDEALNGAPKDFDAAINVLMDAGYIVANLNPTVKGYYYAWDSVNNQILYIDETYEVIFKSKSDVSTMDKWWIAYSDEELGEELQGKEFNAHFVAKDEATLQNILIGTGGIFNASGAVDEKVNFTADVVLTGTEQFKLENKDAKITLDLAGKTISNHDSITVRPFVINSGSLTVSGGSVIAEGTKLTNPTNNTSGAGTGSYGSFHVSGANSSLTLDDMTLANSRPWGLNVKANDGAVVLVENTEITSSYGGGFEAAGATITIKNTTVTQTGFHDHCSTCVSVSGGTGILNVESGTFNAENYGIFVFSSGGTINISGGTFNKTAANSRAFIILTADAGAVSKVNISGGNFNWVEGAPLFDLQNSSCSVTITGGTFNGKPHTEFFENGTTINGCTVTVDGTTVTITK